MQSQDAESGEQPRYTTFTLDAGTPTSVITCRAAVWEFAITSFAHRRARASLRRYILRSN